MRKLVILLALGALFPFAFAACGGDDDDDDETAATTTPTQTTTGGGGGGGGGGETVAVSADPSGNLAFEQDSLTASAGSVTFEFTNDAPTTHDFCLEGDVGDLGCTDQISGSSDTLTVDLDAGEYEFYCSVAGHEDAGMKGTLTVD